MGYRDGWDNLERMYRGNNWVAVYCDRHLIQCAEQYNRFECLLVQEVI